MSTNGFSSGGAPRLPNGLTNGYANNSTNGYHVNGDDADDHRIPPTRPSSPDFEDDTTPRVLLNERLAEAPSRMELLRALPASQAPYFTGISDYTHLPGPPDREMNGGPSTPAVSTRSLVRHFLYISRSFLIPLSNASLLCFIRLCLSSRTYFLYVPTLLTSA